MRVLASCSISKPIFCLVHEFCSVSAMQYRKPRHAAPQQILKSRRRLLALSAAATGFPLALGVDGLFFTPRRLCISHHLFGEKYSTERPLRIIQVSDLHMRSFGAVEQNVLQAMHDATPDIVVYTGDMIESPRGISPLKEFLCRCPDVPSFAIPGNWEYRSGVSMHAFSKLFDHEGVMWLVNQSVAVPHARTRIRITGIDDLRCGQPNGYRAVKGQEPALNHLVLAHCPALRNQVTFLPEHSPDLMLSGHTHGGQVTLGGLPLVLPPGSGGYVAGWYGRESVSRLPALYVSRGVGTSMLPMRIGSVPELAIFDWTLS